jgi:flagellar biogenesis protein FliO
MLAAPASGAGADSPILTVIVAVFMGIVFIITMALMLRKMASVANVRLDEGIHLLVIIPRRGLATG